MSKKSYLAYTASAALLVLPALALAATVGPIDFEGYAVGLINGQNGWSATGSAGSGCAVYDEGVSDNASVPGGAPASFGNKSFRISNAVTSGCFGDQAFAPAVSQPAGETSADNGSYGPGPFSPHFESQFDIYAVPESVGDFLSVSPDRGDGARMSYLGFDNQADGIHVIFYDVTDPGHVVNGDSFNKTNLLTLAAGVPHTVRFVMDFVDGPDNDVVKVYIDGVLVHTGTSWEDYYRYDTESNPSLVDQSRTVRTMLFRAGGTAAPSTIGKGYLIDNLSLISGAPSCSTASVVSSTDTHFDGLATTDPAGASSAGAAFPLGTPGNAVVTGPDGFPGAWDTAGNDPRVAGANWVNNISVAPSNPAGGGDGQDGTVDVWRLFTQMLPSVPAGSIISSAALHFSADNSAQAYLDHTNVGSVSTFTTVTDAPLTVSSGPHELEFVVKNDAYTGATNPTAVIYKANVNYCAPEQVQECPAAPAVANALLKAHNTKPKAAPNYVSSVAHHMGPQTFFDGVGPCETDAYKSVVDSYLRFTLGAY